MAMSNIAKMYYFGVGVARSYPEAANWFQLAALRGSAMALNSLSLMYDAGIGVSQDRTVALSLVKKAAQLGYGPAMANLGAMYEQGDGVESNHVEAYAWIVAALRSGVPDEARDALIYRLGAISTQLNSEELAHAQQLAAERSPPRPPLNIRFPQAGRRPDVRAESPRPPSDMILTQRASRDLIRVSQNNRGGLHLKSIEPPTCELRGAPLAARRLRRRAGRDGCFDDR
jgi:TPR repeat protein